MRIQRLILRDRRPSTAACFACWAMEQKVEIVYGEEIIFCTRPTRAAQAEQKSLVPARQAQQTKHGRTPLICTL
jgi:hypothetical protein